MSPIVRALEEAGFVQRDSDPADARVTRLQATAAGERVMWEGRRRRVANLAKLLGRLSPAEVRRVSDAAELVERALTQQS